MFVLELLGTLSLRSDARPVPVAARQKRPLGLLAVLALGGRHGVSRDRIEAYLWPESENGSARHALDQTVYASRHALGSDVILSSGGELQLNPDLLTVDVWEFDDAIRAARWTAAVDRYAGPLLDGVHLASSAELESWIDGTRARLLREYLKALVSLADAAERAGDQTQRVTWCRRLANADPLSAGATKAFMLSLVAAGDRAGAVKQARVHQELVRQQLEMEPDADIEELAASVSRASIATAATTPHVSVPAAAIPGPVPVRELPVGVPVRRASSVAALLVASLALLLIGAATVSSRQARGRVPAVDERSAPRRSMSLPAARSAYLRALEAWSDGSKDGLDTAVANFRRAVELDPASAESWAGLANAYVMLGYFGYRPGDATFPQAKDAALRSIRLDSALASPRPALAYALTWERDFVRADAEFRKAVALEPPRPTAQALARNPAIATAHQWYPILMAILALRPEVPAAISQPVAADPFTLHVPIVELTFTKWIDVYPAMAGFTSNGPGTMTGAVLSRIEDGATTHMVARYEVTDPAGTHAFKTVVQGTADNASGVYHLNGIVAWGWMTGAHVHSTFRRITPCRFGTRNVCFQGTIRLQRG
jgi:DNA-binding SARP family transcriptional activator